MGLSFQTINMKEQRYNLSWDIYSDHTKEMLHNMMKSEELTDVTLVSDDKKQFKAHKFVLSACSEVFKSIINHLQPNNSVIYLRGIQHEEMQSILEFMYLGETTISQERMKEFINVAKHLEIKEISKNPEFEDEAYDDLEKSVSQNDKDDDQELPNTNEVSDVDIKEDVDDQAK